MSETFGTVTYKPPAIVFVDLSNFVHTCFWPAYDAYLADKQKYPYQRVLFTNVEGKLGTMERDFQDGGIPAYNLVFVEDRTSKRKYDLFPGYKGARGKDDDAEKAVARTWLKQKGVAGVKEWLRAKGYKTFVYSEDNEADDTIATLVRMVHENNLEEHPPLVVIASSDKDLWQLYNPGKVDIYHMTKGIFLDMEEISKKFNGVSKPELIPLVKALWGDTSDSIPNAVPRMQKQLLPIIEKTDGSLNDFLYKSAMASLTDRCKELLQKNTSQVCINYNLAKLDLGCKLTWERG